MTDVKLDRCQSEDNPVSDLIWEKVETPDSVTGLAYFHFIYKSKKYHLSARTFLSKHLPGVQHELELYVTLADWLPYILLQRTHVPAMETEQIQRWAEEIVQTPMEWLSDGLP